MKLFLPIIVDVIELAVTRHGEGVFVAFLCLIECRPRVLGVVAGRLEIPVVATIAIEEHLAFPRFCVTHVETALNPGVETTVGKRAAPVLVNVEGNQVLLAVELDECFLLVSQQNVLVIVPAVGNFENEFAVDVILSRSIIVAAS